MKKLCKRCHWNFTERELCHKCAFDARWGTKEYQMVPVGERTVLWLFDEIISKCQGEIS
jgi:hypothetical protein